MAAPQFDEAKVRALHEQGHSQRAIAKMLGIPRTTLVTRMRAMGLSPDPQRPESIPDAYIEVKESTPYVHTSIPHGMLEDFEELVVWWRQRKALLHDTADGSRKTERITFHVEQRWIEAIRRLADLEHLTYTQIVNQAFQQFFTHKST